MAIPLPSLGGEVPAKFARVSPPQDSTELLIAGIKPGDLLAAFRGISEAK